MAYNDIHNVIHVVLKKKKRKEKKRFWIQRSKRLAQGVILLKEERPLNWTET